MVDFDGVPAVIVTVFSTDLHRPFANLTEMLTATVHVAAEDLQLTGSYEATGDVLYLSASGDEKTGAAQETPEGHAVRLDGNGHVTHVTAINARWLLDQHGELVATLRDGRHRLIEPWTYAVTPPARRDLRHLDPPVQRRITKALERFVEDPYAGDIRRLNTIEWRLRAGDWRVRLRLR